MSRTRTITTEVDVDVDLADFDVEDLQEELRRRNADTPGDIGDLIAQMWTAFYTGKEAQAIALARQIAETATGRMVPAPITQGA